MIHDFEGTSVSVLVVVVLEINVLRSTKMGMKQNCMYKYFPF